jgi:vacuolar-type H+-ATPase subunit I/STV1
MDQMVTTFAATQEYLRSQLDEKTDKIIQLEKALEAARDINRSNAREMNDTRDAIQAWTFEEFENGQLTESQAEEIAGICGFELTKETEVEVTVTYSLTVTAGPTDDVEDIVNNINFDTIDYDEQLISSLNASIDRIDF